MLTSDEEILLQDYKKAFRKYFKGQGVIELDKTIRKNLNFFIVRVNDVLPDLGYKVPPSRQSSYSIIYISKGKGEQKIGSISLKIKKNTLVVIPAHILYSASFGQDVSGYILLFNLSFFLHPYFPRYNLLKFNLFDSAVIPYNYLPDTTGKYVSHIFDTIYEEHHHDRKRKGELMALKILELIILCDRVLQTKNQLKNKSLHPLIIKFLDLLQEHFQDQHSTGYYAEIMHIHPNSLNALCKKYLGRSAKASINSLLIAEAKYLLHQTTDSAKEIAYRLGFSSPSQFFRFFKLSVGVSPLTYRSDNLKMQQNGLKMGLTRS